MWGLLGALGGSLTTGLAGMWGANKQAKSQRETNEANAQQAENQMAFQERMSNTSHQREVADLKAAGLNPLLSVNGGASTPAGAMANFSNPYQDYGNTMIHSASAITEGVGTAAEVMFKAAQTKATLATAEKIQAETKGLSTMTRGIDAVDNIVAKAAQMLGTWSATVGKKPASDNIADSRVQDYIDRKWAINAQ